MTDEYYMRRAIALAQKGEGQVSPNPLVGAVIVKDGKIIGEGYHEHYGQPHAERNALANCIQSPEGATIYVTLEPCCHHGKQPPCTDALLAAGIRRVVIGSKDPNPLVHGKGIRILREHGVEVTEQVLQDECDEMNEVFFHYIQTKLPFVILKYAMTLDGKIATYTGASRWVTGEAARAHVHRMRNRYHAIMVGVGTVLADDPMLNVRVEGWKSPVRIVCDSSLRIPLDSQIVRSAKEYRTIVAYAGREENEEITEKIAKNLKTGWTIERISKVDVSLLKLAIYEMNYMQTPFKIIINEVVNMAKKYGEDSSPAFVNGVLAKIVEENNSNSKEVADESNEQ